MRPEDVRDDLPTPPPVQELPKLPIEEIGEALGIYPEVKERKRNPEFWKFAATQAFKNWRAGELVTEKQFRAALEQATGLTHR